MTTADSSSDRNPSRRAFLSTAAAVVAVPGVLSRHLTSLAGPTLALPPLLTRPTTSSILIHVRNGSDAVAAALDVTASGSGAVVHQPPVVHAAPREFLEWPVAGLLPGTRYRYRIRAITPAGTDTVLAQGGFITQRTGNDPYTMAFITDPHTGTFAEGSPQVQVMDDVVRNVARDNPEFVIGLGDNVAWDSPAGSRNYAQPTTDAAERSYDMYRRHVGPITGNSSHFSALGNWEGETGKFPKESIDRVRSVRHRFLPNPDQHSYPQGGSEGQDYYAFTWGAALYVVLNVQSYTKASTPITLPSADDVAVVQDWTLGAPQMAWLQRTLKESTSPFKFLCIHHAVGGNGGNPHDTLYGRGGARAAAVGEQKIVHQLMRDHGVQVFFYGHDHVFVDDTVDGIHYALPGSFGAPWHFAPGVTGYERYWTASGHARVSVSPNEARVEFIDQSGVAFHSFTVAPR